jgi:uncharacterized membrane protein YoaK (UPF0700 family)
MQRKLHGQMSESFLIAGILSVSGGLQDAYTYMYRGKVFANAQTGNIVLLAQNLVDRNWQAALRYFSPLLFFALGVAMAECIRMRYQKAQKIHWRQLVLVMEIVLLFAVGFFPNDIDLLANAMVSFACAMQVQAFRKVNGYAFASTMCIGNLRSGMESLCAYGKTKDKKILKKSGYFFSIWERKSSSKICSTSFASLRMFFRLSRIFCSSSMISGCSSFSSLMNIHKKLISKIRQEIQMVFAPMYLIMCPPSAAPMANRKMIPK